MKHANWDEARADIGPGHAVILWKNGCFFCDMLMEQLADDDRSTWVNIHEDEAAAEYVRSVNDGNELTPTVVIGDEVYRNPDADEVRAALG